jgi:hypothetical protein
LGPGRQSSVFSRQILSGRYPPGHWKWLTTEDRQLPFNLLESGFREDCFFMVDESARQKAEDHYYAALDLVAEGDQEHALAEYQLSLAADPVFTEAMHGMARTLQNLDRHRREANRGTRP